MIRNMEDQDTFLQIKLTIEDHSMMADLSKVD